MKSGVKIVVKTIKNYETSKEAKKASKEARGTERLSAAARRSKCLKYPTMPHHVE